VATRVKRSEHIAIELAAKLKILLAAAGSEVNNTSSLFGVYLVPGGDIMVDIFLGGNIVKRIIF